MIKRTEGLYTEESARYKHGGDLDFFCKMFEKHLQKYGLDTIAYREDPTKRGTMISLFSEYPKLTAEEVKIQNIIYSTSYDEYDKQNDKEAIECFLNSINEELCKDILARTEDKMLFSEIFMIFIEHERPQHGEL